MRSARQRSRLFQLNFDRPYYIADLLNNSTMEYAFMHTSFFPSSTADTQHGIVIYSTIPSFSIFR